MKRLEMLAISSNFINETISADVKGTVKSDSGNIQIEEKSFKVCIYPDKDDSLFLEIGEYNLKVNPNFDAEYKSENGIEYINCNTDKGYINIQITNIRGVQKNV